jgi:hypothetical protein
MSQVDVNQLQRTAKAMTPRRTKLLNAVSEKLSNSPREGEERLRQAALELRSIQVRPEEAAAFHHLQAEKGVAPELNAQAGRLYDEVAQRGLLKYEGGRVKVSPRFPALERADRAMAQVQHGGEQLIREYGLMGEEGPQARLNAPGEKVYGTGRPGEGFVSERPLLPNSPRSQAAEARGSGGSVGEAKRPINKTGPSYTGEGRRQGQVVANTTKTVGAHGRQLLRYANTVEQRIGLANKFGHAARRSAHDVLIQVPGEKNIALDAETKALLGKGDLNFDEAQQLQAKLDSLDEALRQKPQSLDEAKIGTEAPEGKLWVDERVLRQANDASTAARSGWVKAVDAINAGITAGTVFFKPAHIPQRLVTNAIANVIQGSLPYW